MPVPDQDAMSATLQTIIARNRAMTNPDARRASASASNVMTDASRYEIHRRIAQANGHGAMSPEEWQNDPVQRAIVDQAMERTAALLNRNRVPTENSRQGYLDRPGEAAADDNADAISRAP